MKTQKRNKFGWFVVLLVSLSFTSLFVSAQDKYILGEQIVAEKPIGATKVIKDINDDMSPEERLIRHTYRKLSIYEVANRLSKADREGKPKGRELADKSLKFKLKNFQIGRKEDIQNKQFSDLVSLPTGEIIDITSVNTSINQAETMFSIKAKWKNAQYLSGFDSQWTLANLLQLEAAKYQDVGKYASYEVTVSFEGKTKTYQAVALFHNPYGLSQKLKPEFLDYVIDMGDIVTKVFEETRLPLGLGRASKPNQNTKANNTSKYAKAKFEGKVNPSPNYLSDDCTISMFDFGSGCNCVDWWSPGSDWLTYWSEPLCNTAEIMPVISGSGSGSDGGCTGTVFYASQGQDIDTGRAEHTSGGHQAHTLLDHTCLQNNNCQTNCKIVDTIAEITEEGDLIALTIHKTAKDVIINERSGGRNTTVSCETAVGYGAKSCYSILGCTASVSVGITGTGGNATASLTPNDNLYSRKYIYGGSCRNGR